MGQTIWSIIAVVGGFGTIAVVLYFLVAGRNDRAAEEAARRHFDQHGYWPGEEPPERE